jgi:hypothetical protein
MLKGFSLTNGLFNTTPFAKSANTFGYLGAGLSISAAPNNENAIVWALDGTKYPAVLYAYNALTLEELYDTSQAANKADNFGHGVKLSIPTVANGKVYVGTQNNVTVYGLKSSKK